MILDDYDETHALWRQCEGVRISALDDREGFDKFLQRNPGFSQTARIDGKLAAAVMCGHDGRIGYLHHAAVAPQFRRSGIGRAIVGRCLELLKAAGVKAVYAFVVETNSIGHDFWKSLGWTVRDVDVMQREL
jgi:putative acetyltransferase